MKSLWFKIRSTVENLSFIAAGAFLSIIPRNRRLIVFGAWEGTRYDDNARYLFEYCLSNRKDLRCVWHTASGQVEEEMRAMGLPVYRIRSARAFYNICRAKYIVCTNSDHDYGWNFFSCGATVVNLWHGSGPKKAGYEIGTLPTKFGQFQTRVKRDLMNYHYVTTSGWMADRYSRLFNIDRKRVLNLGQARNDLFYSPHDNPLRALYPGRRIVVYMPTFREEGGEPVPMDLGLILDLPRLDALCEKHGMVFLVKFHQWTAGTVPPEYKNIRKLYDISLRVQMILDAADILITDYSSCFVDHLLLDRPQILFAYDLRDYMTKDRSLYGDYRSDATGPVCEDSASLLAELERVAAGSDSYSSKRHLIRDRYYSPENQCPVAGKQLEAILSL
ncbi:MAG: CDP-glycerol glycerophosphotransferase family protein [Bacteroidales bacterium]|nr:CDP-glycerol glycerophosphotransferase family protein [Bacteroidales bacterium]